MGAWRTAYVVPLLSSRVSRYNTRIVSALSLVVTLAALPLAPGYASPVHRTLPTIGDTLGMRADLQRVIKPGMPFVDFRQIALAKGWTPIPHDPPCLRQVGPALCAQLPELFNTSSGPIEYNELSYREPGGGSRLHVLVEGDISKWGTADARVELRVDQWDFSGKDDSN